MGSQFRIFYILIIILLLLSGDWLIDNNSTSPITTSFLIEELRSLSAINTPDVVQNFDLNIAGYGLPDFFCLGCK